MFLTGILIIFCDEHQWTDESEVAVVQPDDKQKELDASLPSEREGPNVFLS